MKKALFDLRKKQYPLKNLLNGSQESLKVIKRFEEVESNDWIDEYSHFTKRKVSSIESEMEQYLKEDTSAKTDDPLASWKTRQSIAP